METCCEYVLSVHDARLVPGQRGGRAERTVWEGRTAPEVGLRSLWGSPAFDNQDGDGLPCPWRQALGSLVSDTGSP